jgi:hypothetical protein
MTLVQTTNLAGTSVAPTRRSTKPAKIAPWSRAMTKADLKAAVPCRMEKAPWLSPPVRIRLRSIGWNEQAIRAAREADRVEPRATAITYDRNQALVLVHLRSGFMFGFPPERIPGLEGATHKKLSNARISPSGDGLHWDELDVHASLTGLMTDALNLREWAPRSMGQVRSEAEAKAARKNGLKGGRPRSATKRSTSSKHASDK